MSAFITEKNEIYYTGNFEGKKKGLEWIPKKSRFYDDYDKYNYRGHTSKFLLFSENKPIKIFGDSLEFDWIQSNHKIFSKIPKQNIHFPSVHEQS